jgi:hypothetical protein
MHDSARPAPWGSAQKNRRYSEKKKNENPKSEARNPKQTPMTKIRMFKKRIPEFKAFDI